MDRNSQRRAPAPRTRSEAQPSPRPSTQPWEYGRHLETEHNLFVGVEEGWPSAVKRYRLFRPMEKNRPERTLLVFTGSEPAALAHFFNYIHPVDRR